MKTLYIECKMGAAGDMLTAGLYELLSEHQKQEFLEQMNSMFGQDIRMLADTKTAGGITGTHMHVHVLGQEESAFGHEHTHDAHPHGELAHLHSEHGQHTHEHHEHGHSHDHEHPHEGHKHTHETHPHEDHDHTHTHNHSHSHHSYRAILERIQELPLSADVRGHASAVYRLIGEAEAKVHQTELDQIHFHEVGSLDALADVVACCLLFSMLAPERIVCSPIHVGSGTVRCAHGILPVPAPATAELLKGIPCYTGQIDSELCTPTGAAILKHFADCFGPMPAMNISQIGVGHGTKEFAVLNAMRTFLGESADHTDIDTDHADQIADISCNLDDMTGEALGYCMELLLDAGALDVFYIPIQMKKNRPGILLHCLCAPERLDTFCRLILRHTTTRGVRYQYFDRKKLTSRVETVETPVGAVRRKVSEGDRIAKAKYEFEDLKRIAAEQGLSLYELIEMIADKPDGSLL